MSLLPSSSPSPSSWNRILNEPVSRRRWLLHGLWLAPSATALDAAWFEPHHASIQTFTPTLPHPKLGKRLVQISDIHFKGNSTYLSQVVDQINRLSPDAVVFSGDLIEEREFLAPALKLLDRLEAPVYAIPGNHDDWSGADFSPARKQFTRRGGGWHENEQVKLFGGELVLHCLTASRGEQNLRFDPGVRNVALMHYPGWADSLTRKYDLLLAGHTHGGQVRFPFVGAFVLPHESGSYEKGWYPSPAGPLYVNPGIGTFYLNIRFNCRPEITVFDL